MKRRQVLKCGVGAVLVASIAGCSGDGTDPDDTDAEANADGGTQTSQYPDEPAETGDSGMQRLIRNRGVPLEIRAVEEVSITDSEFVLDVTI